MAAPALKSSRPGVERTLLPAKHSDALPAPHTHASPRVSLNAEGGCTEHVYRLGLPPHFAAHASRQVTGAVPSRSRTGSSLTE
jgi:hypothetical protein